MHHHLLKNTLKSRRQRSR